MSNALFMQLLKERVIVLDGAMGTSLQRYDLGLDDFENLEGCNEVLTRTRPDVVQEIHAAFLEVGCDGIETNTFGANRVVLAEYGIAEQNYELNLASARLAKQVCQDYRSADRPRFVIGSIGPGTKLPTLGQTTFQALHDSYEEQARGLLDGGADVLLVETCQDPLQLKAALAGCRGAMIAAKTRVPLMAQVTMEQTGTMLMGTDMLAAWTILEAFSDIDVVGLNCATGPEAMVEHIRVLSNACDRAISCLPNAGLPVMVDGQAQYQLSPEELAQYHGMFVREFGLNVVGGCCGTTPEHLAAVVEEVWGEVPAKREPTFAPSVASLYSSVPLRQDTSFLIVGERTNANGSKLFRTHLEEGNLEGMVRMAREQVQEGAHVLDVCTAYVGRDEEAEMSAVVERFTKDVTAPLMVDTTEPPVAKAAFERIGGRAILNSINLEDGGERLHQFLPEVKRHGAAVVALTIDEDGMAKTAEQKLAIARRIYEIAVGEYGLRPQDLLFDTLTFTLGSGEEEFRRAGLETMEGIRRIKEELPGVHTILGVSNISFGLKPAARVVLNSVFLHHAMQEGLDAAIVHAAKILPLNRFSDEERELADRLIRDDRSEGSDPLIEFMALFEGEDSSGRFGSKKSQRAETIEEELQRRIIEGDREGIEQELDTALQTYAPLQIINEILLEGMKVVGELFGAGEMQLPFVLQSAETMKAAVSYLEPMMEKVDGSEKGRIVLATVKGDVHDIGKNLVDIILSNNGYKTYNLGIKVPIGQVIDAAKEHQADAIGLSGLLVKSTLIMREDLEELNRLELDWPVILGGAALTRKYVEQDLRAVYRGRVFYAKDAFEGLKILEEMPEPSEPAHAPARPATSVAIQGSSRPVDTTRSDVAADVPVPAAPFLGWKVVDDIPLEEIWPYLNEIALFRAQWQFKQQKLSHGDYEQLIETTVRPLLQEWKQRCMDNSILAPRVLYGYWNCVSEGNDLVILDEQGSNEVERFHFPRQSDRRRLCISDFFRSRDSGETDVIGLSLVTVGDEASRRSQELFQADKYQDYLYLHGLAVEAAEALAERWHQRMRQEMGIASDDVVAERDILDGGVEQSRLRKLLSQGYRGSRYSFGYPACPDLSDQEKLARLLPFEKIGVELSESWQLHPEQSTSAIVVHHPEAKYFAVAGARQPTPASL